MLIICSSTVFILMISLDSDEQLILLLKF